MKTALVTGFTGQDGTFLTELLLKKGYTVIGLCRRISTEPPHRVRGRFTFEKELTSGQLILEQGDLLSRASLDRIIQQHQPNEIYNLAAQSDVHISFKEPEATIQSTFLGLVNLVESLRANSQEFYRLYQASTSEMFGDVAAEDVTGGFTEHVPFNPNSPYAISKTAAHFYCRYARAAGEFVSMGILFNHESEIRGGNFVTQKIIRGMIKFSQTGETLKLGNLESVRDWGYAGDYVEAMWLMLQQNQPDEFVIGTGKVHKIRDFVEETAKQGGLTVEWRGEGKTETGWIDGKLAIEVVPEFWRDVDVTYLQGNADKARTDLGWTPKVSFEELVKRMFNSEIEKLNEGRNV